ncbi:MAG: zinc-ribbon domain-containing protein [Peptococcaceae bacterium]|nr:zinc-ribbon domain-containing protein [Peptococcaceae bacterium]
MIKCQNCNNTIDTDSVFCKYCGSKIESEERKYTILKCNQCQAENDLDADFCKHCGSNDLIKEEQTDFEFLAKYARFF